jgi:hypothetical protein
VPAHAQATTHWNNRLRTEAGLRADTYYFEVTSDTPRNSAGRATAISSPKFGLVFSATPKTKLYLNAGLGFHSNDARGTTIRVDPADGTTPVDRVDPLFGSRGFETGLRTSFLPGVVSTVSLGCPTSPPNSSSSATPAAPSPAEPRAAMASS